MPRGDGNGPAGMGPITGRRMGYCAGYNMPGFANMCFGRGFGRGFGRRWAITPMPVAQHVFKNVSAQPYTKEEEAEDLKVEKELLERDVKAIEKRLNELKRKNK